MVVLRKDSGVRGGVDRGNEEAALGSEGTPGSREQAMLFEAARSAAEEFGYADSELGLIKEERVASGIVRRQIYSVSARYGVRHVLRGYRPAFSGLNSLLSSEDALWSQQHWLSFLAGREGDEFLRPVPASHGTFVVKREVPGLDSEGSERPRLFLMQTFLPGNKVFVGNLREDELAAMGAAIARMHRASILYDPPEGFVRPTWDWEYVFGDWMPLWRYGREYLCEAEMEVIAEASRIAWWDLKALGRGSRVFGIIHRDLHPNNWLFDRGAARIVDFDETGWGYYLYDLAFPLSAVDDIHGMGSETSRRLCRALIRGYESESSLPLGYEDFMDTFLAMRRVSKMSAVLATALSSRPRKRPAFLSEALESLTDFTASRGPAGRRSYLLRRSRLIRREARLSRFFGSKFGPRNPALFIPAGEFQYLLSFA